MNKNGYKPAFGTKLYTVEKVAAFLVSADRLGLFVANTLRLSQLKHVYISLGYGEKRSTSCTEQLVKSPNAAAMFMELEKEGFIKYDAEAGLVAKGLSWETLRVIGEGAVAKYRRSLEKPEKKKSMPEAKHYSEKIPLAETVEQAAKYFAEFLLEISKDIRELEDELAKTCEELAREKAKGIPTESTKEVETVDSWYKRIFKK